jgi:hypothetical protein
MKPREMGEVALTISYILWELVALGCVALSGAAFLLLILYR